MSIKPYYEHQGITIYHGDCREILPEIGRFDLLLTDPPYGIKAGAKGKVGGVRNLHLAASLFQLETTVLIHGTIARLTKN